ncbi:MAG: aldo/keto reductase [Myxococcales bacterium]|nr:aldo/keto reductase [Myxococcales bacterium]
MKQSFLGDTGVRISQLVLGTMSFGRDEQTDAAIFGRARDAGVNTFDCADVYQEGASERALGRLIKGCRDEVVITTKGYFPTSGDSNARGSSRYHLVRAVEASLRRLETDYIDIYFLHRYDDVTSLESTLRAVDDLMRQGKLLYVAASNFSAWQTVKALGVQTLHGYSRLCCVQPMYNLLKRQAEVEILEMARAERLGVFSYSPLAGGLLSGKYGVDDTGARRAPQRGRIVDVEMYKTRYDSDAYFAIAERFTTLAHERGVHPATLAIAWVASHPSITAPIIGARDVAQLEPCLAAADLELDAEARAAIGALSPEPPPATDRNEERTAHNFGSR